MMIFASMFSAGQIRALAEQAGTSNFEMLNRNSGSLENLLGYLKEGFDGNKEFQRIDN